MSAIEGAADAARAPVENVGVDHRRPNVVVSEELLDGADVVALLQKVGRKRMAQGVGSGVFGDASGTDGGFDRTLDDGLMQVVPPPISGSAIDIVTGRWEDPLPRPVAPGGGVFSVQRVG
jgi:hypothetical protein